MRHEPDLNFTFGPWMGTVHEVGCVEVGRRALLAAMGGPRGAEIRVFDAADGSVVAEYSVGSRMVAGPRDPIHVDRAGGRAVLNVGINHGRQPLPGLGSYFVRQLDLLSGEETGIAFSCPAPVVSIKSRASVGRAVLAVLDKDGGVTQFDMATGERLSARLRHPGADAFSFAQALGAKAAPALAVVGSWDGHLSAWDLVGERLVWNDGGNSLPVFSADMCVVDNRAYLAVVRRSQYVELRDAMTGEMIFECLPVIDPEYPSYVKLEMLGGRAILYVANGLGIARIDIDSGEKVYTTISWPEEITAVQPAVVAGREVLFLADEDGIYMLDAATGEVLVGRAVRG
jgi:outer membrane protein assembly factor BamB